MVKKIRKNSKVRKEIFNNAIKIIHYNLANCFLGEDVEDFKNLESYLNQHCNWWELFQKSEKEFQIRVHSNSFYKVII